MRHLSIKYLRHLCHFSKLYEIKSDKLHISINEQSLTAMLSKIRDSLGLSGNSVLTAHLHNMLIYQPGQFFDMHQDSEKLENMVASLVVVLPSPHIGGDLIIEHGKKKKIFSSENIDQSNAKCIGFYADCKHKVEKIKIEPEAFGRTITEGQSMEKLVIATNIGGAIETILDKKTGVHVKPNDAVDLAEKIEHCLSILKTNEGKKIQQAARKAVIDNFSLDLMLSKTLDIYKKMLKKT